MDVVGIASIMTNVYGGVTTENTMNCATNPNVLPVGIRKNGKKNIKL